MYNVHVALDVVVFITFVKFTAAVFESKEKLKVNRTVAANIVCDVP